MKNISQPLCRFLPHLPAKSDNDKKYDDLDLILKVTADLKYQIEPNISLELNGQVLSKIISTEHDRT